MYIYIYNGIECFWNKAKSTIRWKLFVFDVIIKSKLLCGLEAMQLTNAEIQRINAFQMKGVRRILGVPPTHIDRQWTNERVWDKAKLESKDKILRF